ncbi:DNA/RNA polymerase [Auricularia subglabra TFB-10046 SS5]|nr:DNA/RNA polymerase [Auricularia subglabra TFB-10046 SS5]
MKATLEDKLVAWFSDDRSKPDAIMDAIIKITDSLKYFACEVNKVEDVADVWTPSVLFGVIEPWIRYLRDNDIIRRKGPGSKGRVYKDHLRQDPLSDDALVFGAHVLFVAIRILAYDGGRDVGDEIMMHYGQDEEHAARAALSQGDKPPNPQSDAVCAVFYAFSPKTAGTIENASTRPRTYTTGIIAVSSATLHRKRLREHKMEVVDSEIDLLKRVIDVVLELDPDIVAGWEVQMASWGYLRGRANAHSVDFLEACGRARFPAGRQQGNESNTTLTHIIQLVGRHVLNVREMMRVSMGLSSYNLETVAFHVLRRRLPHYPAKTLTGWMQSALPLHNSRVLAYLAERTASVLDILHETETISKHVESARVLGIDFSSSVSRGSQYKVESFLFRIAKPESFVMLSPSHEEVGKQESTYATPMVLEPSAGFYPSPLVVLDFQSLYPSIMIAYNYCYSTCLGRVEGQQSHQRLGVRPEFKLPPGLLDKLQDYISVAPNGIMYAKKEVRAGLLGRMLQELLDTRVMVQQAMKSSKGDQVFQRALDARQLSLKFICNTTYGYTSAGSCGRMPAVEIADSVVQSGRETLEQAMRTIQNTSKWGATVVYGDTDSIFVCLPGRTKEQAFRIGHDMADKITAMNPEPIKLKFEKVYLPSLLMGKKRYAGLAYKDPDELEPVFDAKGIETVRRDGIPCTQKMQEAVLRMLFETQDLSAIKTYCERTWRNILEGREQLQEFIFAKEVCMGTTVQYADRIKFVVAQGRAPGEHVVNRAFSPEEFLDLGLELDVDYYIEKMLIPSLHRVLSLVGADVKAWYTQMAKPQRAGGRDTHT